MTTKATSSGTIQALLLIPCEPGQKWIMLQAAEISKGRTVSQLMAYSMPHAHPKEGSTKRQMYMVKAPFIGYRTVISARACIMRYLNDLCQYPSTEGKDASTST